jgi:PST family polysaccharide transporter
MSSVRRGFVLVAAGQGVSMLSSYATHLILARQLGPADYGRYGIFLSVASTVALLLTAGVPEAISKFSAENPDAAPGIFAQGLRLQFRFSLIISVAYALLSPLFAWVLRDVSLAPEFALSALGIPPVAIYALAINAYSGQRRFGAQGLTVSAYGILRCVFAISFAHYQAVRGAVLGLVVAPYVVLAGVLPGVRGKSGPGSVDTRTLIAFARPVILFTVAFGTLMNLDLLVVKALGTSDVQVGFYTAASTIAKVPFFVFSSLAVVLLPTVSAAARAKDTGLAEAREAIRWTFLVSLAIAFAVAPLATPVLRVLYGDRYADSGLALALLVMSGTLLTQVYILTYALNGLGQPQLGMRLTVAGLVLEPALVIAGSRGFGLAGAAAGSCATALVLLVVLLRTAAPLLGKIAPLRTLFRATIAGAVTTAVGSLLPLHGVLTLGFFVPLVALDVLLLLALKETSIAELAAPLLARKAAESP